ncbi:hypothetical protein AXG93_2156s1010 [Marchantia polymorpha subsp. ruderalis]|uniref:Uncharacterized protein n=1 Tax=Marchantia polymorpha subsp. ruderalis TaxID=1480154 RepID=A0A176VH62_MARPO|nr:hypothetical protein AXG93_2156s1010 [Marchantia polymorpha subsp. ruderalis]
MVERPPTRARSKRKASRGLVVTDSSVKKTLAPIVSTPEVAVGESTQPMEIEGSSGVLIEVPADVPTEPLKEGTKMMYLALSVDRTKMQAHDALQWHPNQLSKKQRNQDLNLLLKNKDVFTFFMKDLAAIVMPAKKDNNDLWIEKRMCEDYRPLNGATP